MELLEKRFWANVDVRGPDDCWGWLVSKCQGGYGRMRVNGESRQATHILFYLRHGSWPPKGRTCNHHCDNPGCLNPRHLYLGTRKSNARDRVQHGRCWEKVNMGERNGRARLTDDDARRIRRLILQGDLTQKEIAHRFGVANVQISRIKTGKRWTHVII